MQEKQNILLLDSHKTAVSCLNIPAIVTTQFEYILSVVLSLVNSLVYI